MALANLERIHAVVGDAVQAVFVCGTDFGTQTSAFCSVKTLRDLYFPYYKQHQRLDSRAHPVEDLQALLRRGFEVPSIIH